MKPAPSIRWAEIRAYAERFEELSIIDSIDPGANGELVSLDPKRLSEGRPTLARFGPLAPGFEPAPGSRIGALRRGRASGSVRVEVEIAERGAVTFEIEHADDRGPFGASPLSLTYRSTEIPFEHLEPVAHGLRDALLGGLGASTSAASTSAASTSAASSSAASSSAASSSRAWEAWCAAPDERKAQRALDTDRLEVRADGKVYLRISEACQERCTFCFFYDTDEVDNLVRHQDLREVIEAIDPAGVTQIVLTGGEPTLDPRFVDYVELLAKRGFSPIIVQTNGIRFAEEGFLEALLPYRERLGLGFSLHSASAEVNDAITTVERGYFQRKLVAIRRAAELGFRFKITLVLSRLNLSELESFVELAADLVGEGDGFVQLSLPSFHGRMLRFLDTYPRLVELAEAVPPALARADALGLRVSFCHQCQIPPCVVPDHVKHLESMWFCETPAMWERDRAYGEACAGCAVRPYCSGVWSEYARRFGVDELRPFRADEVELPAIGPR